jgi:hypothetical protein
VREQDHQAVGRLDRRVQELPEEEDDHGRCRVRFPFFLGGGFLCVDGRITKTCLGHAIKWLGMCPPILSLKGREKKFRYAG